MVKRKRAEIPPLPADVERLAYTVQEFCKAMRIGETLYYKMKREGTGPVELELGGGKKLITADEARRWLAARMRELEAEKETPPTEAGGASC